jgi:hypothetical protein
MRFNVATVLMIAAFLVMPGPLRADEDLEGTAFVGAEPTAAERAVDEARVDAAETYVACLRAQTGRWLSAVDYSPCDDERQAYSEELAADVADAAIGCLEEGALGAPRVPGNTCAALHARFPVSAASESASEVAP